MAELAKETKEVTCPNCGVKHETLSNHYCRKCCLRFREAGGFDHIDQDGALSNPGTFIPL